MRFKYLLAASLAFEAIIGSARAYEVTFADRPTGSSMFADAGPAQTLNYSFGNGLSATFTGGTILTQETYQSTDDTNVYATSYFGDRSLTNPLTISFSQNVANFQIDIVNAFAGRYEIYDNLGNTKFFFLETEGSSKETAGFAAAGTMVSIKYLDGCHDFAIDNITFDPVISTSPVPLPASAPLLGAALAVFGIVGYGFKRTKAADPA